MTNEEFETYLQSLGWKVRRIVLADKTSYVVIDNYSIPAGSYAGLVCDVAIQTSSTVPYVAPPAIHTKPALVPMNQYATQASPLGSEWQYWSRLLRGVPTPQRMLAHIATIFSEV